MIAQHHDSSQMDKQKTRTLTESQKKATAHQRQADSNGQANNLSLDVLIELASTDETSIPCPPNPPTDLSLDMLIELASTDTDETTPPCPPSSPNPPHDLSLNELIQLASTDEPLTSAWPALTDKPITRPVTTFSEIARFKQKITHVRLDAGQWATDILRASDLFAMNGVLLQGGCGTGKTTLLTKSKELQSSLFASPTQAIAQQVAENDPRFQLVIENVEPNVEKYKHFASTYDSLWKICDKITEAGLNPYASPLILDEIQHISSDGYKATQINSFMLRVRKFQQIIFTSATILPFVPYFELLPVVMIHRDELETKWGYITGSETALIERELNKGSIVQFHLDDKRLAETYRQAFTKLGFKVVVITADTKNELMEAGLSDKRLPEADLYINTSVFNDGLSVHDISREYVTIISKKSGLNNGPFEIVQYSHRFRDSRPSFVYVCRTNNEFDEESTFTRLTYQFIYKQKLLEAEEDAAHFNRQEVRRQEWLKIANTNEAKHVEETTNYLQKRYSENSLVIWNEEANRFEPNLLAIGHAVYAQMRRAAYKSCHVMTHWLSEFGFVYMGIEHIDQKTATDNDIIKISSNMSKADRETMRSHIGQFNNFDEVRRVAGTKNADLIGSYTEAEEVCLIGTFETWQQEQTKAGKEASREGYRTAIKETVRQQEVKKRAAEHLREMTYHLCSEGKKLDEAFVLAKHALKNSTLTANAITRLKDRAQLSIIAQGARNTNLNLELEGAFIREVLTSVTLNEPLDKLAVDAAFERGFAHSEKDRKRFTIAVKKKQPTEDDLRKAQKRQWQKRRKLLGDFFEFKRSKRVINGKSKRVSIPVKCRF